MTDAKPMTEDELKAIEARAAPALALEWTEGDPARDEDVTSLNALRQDFPALIAEIRRLRTLLREARDELRGDRMGGTWDELMHRLDEELGAE